MIANEGDKLPSWTMDSVSPERMQTMAAILRDPNPVHWDRKSVAQLGLGERCINQGPLGVGYMVNMLQHWAGENCIKRMFIRFPNPIILDGDHIISKGVVTKSYQHEGFDMAEVETWLERDGERGLIEATVTLQLPRD
tara:strand:- start:3395 stop:3808 length:414 start_codon:yes stop_codon:yes gene_type:complete